MPYHPSDFEYAKYTEAELRQRLYLATRAAQDALSTLEDRGYTNGGKKQRAAAKRGRQPQSKPTRGGEKFGLPTKL